MTVTLGSAAMASASADDGLRVGTVTLYFPVAERAAEGSEIHMQTDLQSEINVPRTIGPAWAPVPPKTTIFSSDIFINSFSISSLTQVFMCS